MAITSRRLGGQQAAVRLRHVFMVAGSRAAKLRGYHGKISARNVAGRVGGFRRTTVGRARPRSSFAWFGHGSLVGRRLHRRATFPSERSPALGIGAGLFADAGTQRRHGWRGAVGRRPVARGGLGDWHPEHRSVDCCGSDAASSGGGVRSGGCAAGCRPETTARAQGDREF